MDREAWRAAGHGVTKSVMTVTELKWSDLMDHFVLSFFFFFGIVFCIKQLNFNDVQIFNYFFYQHGFGVIS